MQERTLDAAIDAAYASALDHTQWKVLLERLAALFGCHFADVFARRHDFSVFGGVAHGMERAEYEEQFLGIWVKRNVWGQKRPPRLAGEVLSTRDMLDKSALMRTQMYNDYLAPRGLHEGLRLAIGVSSDWIQDISLLRPWKAGPFADPEFRMARALLPHVQRAAAVAERLREADALKEAGLAALDAISHACLLLDVGGRPVFVNDAAAQLLAARDGLRLESGRLGAASREAGRKLGALIARAASRDGARSGHLRIPRGAGRSSLLVLASPIAAGFDAICPGRNVVLLLVGDPDATRRGAADELRAAFGLTQAEAELAASLLAGSSITEIATGSGRSVNTVRTHLARLMAKTGTSRQSELMRELIASSQLRARPFPVHLGDARRVRAAG